MNLWNIKHYGARVENYFLLFIIYYLLFIIYYLLLFIIYYLLFIIYYLLFIIYYSTCPLATNDYNCYMQTPNTTRLQPAPPRSHLSLTSSKTIQTNHSLHSIQTSHHHHTEHAQFLCYHAVALLSFALCSHSSFLHSPTPEEVPTLRDEIY